MNAPIPIDALATERKQRQSLVAVCRARRWDLLQLFAVLEIALERRLENPPKTFGAKVRAWIETDPAAKSFERLIYARNLVAHAAVQCAWAGSSLYVLWEVADGTHELNCAKFDKVSLEQWCKEISDLLDEATARA